jgi:hypothetical protein
MLNSRLWSYMTETFIVLSRVRGLRDNNKRGFSVFSEGVYLNYCIYFTRQISHTISGLVAHKLESSSMTIVESVLVTLGRSVLPCAPECGPQLT